jgi:hypothetical protein
MPMNAGGIQHMIEKKRMTSDASLRLIPKTAVASVPAGILVSHLELAIIRLQSRMDTILTAKDKGGR